MSVKRQTIAWALLLLLRCVSPATADSFEPVQFIVYGDLPYSIPGHPVTDSSGHPDDKVFDSRIEPAIRVHAAAFVIHVGDLGRPQTSCQDTDLLRNRGIWQSFDKPVFYTPGDNDWIDCVRTWKGGGGYQPLERLAALRKLLFSAEALATYLHVPAGWSVRHDLGGLPENTAWTTDNSAVAFATLHVVSSCDGRDTNSGREAKQDHQWVRHACKMSANEAHDEAERRLLVAASDRDRRNIAALEEAYREATENSRRVLVIVMQADMFAPANITGEPRPVGPWARCRQHTEFRTYCRTLRDLAARFTGDTLLINGDTSAYCLEQFPLDSPLGAAAGHRFWRLNTPGDFAVIDASVVTISADNDGTAQITATGLLSGKPAPTSCDGQYR